MKNLPLILVGLVLAAAAAGWYLFQDGDDGPELARSKRAIEAGDDDERAIDLPRREARDDASLAPAVVDAGADDEDAEPGYREQPADGLLVRVVNAETQAPLPNIDVYVVSESMLPDDFYLLRRSPIRLMRRLGHRYRADGEGRLRVARIDDRSSVLAFGGGWYGQKRVRDAVGEVVVEAKPLPSTLVRVLDGAGKPVVGAPVAWRAVSRFGGRSFTGDRFVELTEPPRGEVRMLFPDVGNRREGVKHFVALQGAFAEPVQEEIDFDAMPEEVVLRAPASGTVVVEVYGADGELEKEARFAVALQVMDAASGSTEDGPSDDGRSCWGEVVGGRAELPFVGLGLDLNLALQGLRGSSFAPLSQRIRGPVAAGELVTARVDLPAAPTRVVVTGRLLDEEGRPVASARVQAGSEERHAGGSGSSSQPVTTDEDGCFRASFDVVESGPGTNWFICLEQRLPGGRERKAEFEFTGRGPGEYDLGDVVLRADPLLASGRVLGPEGRPVVEAWVSATAAQDPNDPRSFPRFGFQTADARTSSAGDFELRGTIEADRIQVQVSAANMAAEPVEVARGATGLEIRMRALAVLKAKIVVKGGAGPEDVMVDLRADDDDYQGGGSGIGQDGVYESGVEPGRYAFRVVAANGGDEILHERRGLQLVAGETLDLGEIEVRRQGRRLELTVDLGENADDFLWGEFRLFEPGKDSAFAESNEPLHGEPVRFFVKSLPVEVEVEAPGYRRLRTLVKEEKARLKLERGLDVKLQFLGLGGFAEDVIMQVHLQLESRDDWSQYGGFADFRPRDGEVSLRTTEPGRHRLDFMIGIATETSSTLTSVMMKEPVVIEVKDSSTLQVFDIRPDRAALEAALAEMRKDR